MKNYYIVDRFETLYDCVHRGMFRFVRARGLYHPNEMELDDAALCALAFVSSSAQIEWEAILGVESLGDPLDNIPMQDSHLKKLSRDMDFELVDGDTNEVVLPSAEVFATKPMDKLKINKDGKPVQPHHVRQAMAYIAKNKDPEFLFQLL